MKELELNSDQKAKVAYLIETTPETFQNLTLILIMHFLAQFNPISITLCPDSRTEEARLWGGAPPKNFSFGEDFL